MCERERERERGKIDHDKITPNCAGEITIFQQADFLLSYYYCDRPVCSSERIRVCVPMIGGSARQQCCKFLIGDGDSSDESTVAVETTMTPLLPVGCGDRVVKSGVRDKNDYMHSWRLQIRVFRR